MQNEVQRGARAELELETSSSASRSRQIHWSARFLPRGVTMFATRCCRAALLLLAISCAKQSAPNVGNAPGERITKDPDVISIEELQDPAIAGTDALTAIRQLRPAFFRQRGPQTLRANADPASAPGMVHISQDYGQLQPVTALTEISARILIEVRYLNAVDAQARFGINANGGPVIVVLTRRQ